MSRPRNFVFLLVIASVLLPAQLATAGKNKHAKSRSASGSLRLSGRRIPSNSASGRKSLAPNRSRRIAETIKRTYGNAQPKRKSQAARTTREVVELYKQAEERKTRDLLRQINQKTQRSAGGSLRLTQPATNKASEKKRKEERGVKAK